MAYNDLSWQQYTDLRTYSTRIIGLLKDLIRLRDIENPEKYDEIEINSLKEALLNALMFELGLLDTIRKRSDSDKILSSFIEKAENEEKLDPHVKKRLLSRLNSAIEHTDKYISIDKLKTFEEIESNDKMFELRWGERCFSIKEIITTHLNILLIQELSRIKQCGCLFGTVVIALPNELSTKLNDQLSDIILSSLSFTSYFELLFALYGYFPNREPLIEIEKVLVGDEKYLKHIQDEFQKFIKELNTRLSKFRNNIGEYSIKEEPQELAQLLTILNLLEILIPCMSDKLLMSLKTQLEWGINVGEEKYTPEKLLFHIKNELKRRNIMVL